ncbi:MAG: hypothetical protein NPIRA03_30200 [Nitrospirales bacterium]|nr:MAG: hypothetical protein NPIRA03_30200 [Nitrospirales bacterium]
MSEAECAKGLSSKAAVSWTGGAYREEVREQGQGTGTPPADFLNILLEHIGGCRAVDEQIHPV